MQKRKVKNISDKDIGFFLTTATFLKCNAKRYPTPEIVIVITVNLANKIAPVWPVARLVR